MTLIPTASQTLGPFFNFGLTTNAALGCLRRAGAQGESIRLEFRIIDGDAVPSPGDCMIEIWQPDSCGRYAHPLDPRAADADPNFCGFGRLETNPAGICVFETVKPGGVPGPDGRSQAPHINVVVFARGLLKHLYTRVYFAGDPSNLDDPVLALVPENRRATLLAQPARTAALVPENRPATLLAQPAPTAGLGDPALWRIEIRLQGEHETVFFDV